MELVEVVHRMMNHDSAFARSSSTWSSSSALWTTFVTSIAPYPSGAADTALCTFNRHHRTASAPIRSVHGLDHRCPLHQA